MNDNEIPHKLKLHGFNNLTKSISFNIYDICYAKTPEHRREYREYVDELYNAERLTQILTTVTDIIGATILNIARQDYDPEGASVTMLIAEHPIALQLRYLQTLREVAAEHKSTTLFPIPIALFTPFLQLQEFMEKKGKVDLRLLF